LNFDGTAETDGHLTIIGGAGDDILKGGSDGDRFDLSHGGEDTATGGAGNDLFLVGGALDSGDKIDGGFTPGPANNIVRFDGDYSTGLMLGADTLQNIQTLQFSNGFDYKIIADNANFVSGPLVLVTAASLGASHSLNFDGSASDAGFHFIGGAGDDVLTGGTAADVFDLSHGGDDTASGGDLSDRFIMGATFTAADTINGGAGNDIVEISGMGTADTLTLGATTLVSVETLTLDSGFGSYDIVTNDGNVAAGATMLVRGEALSDSEPLTFDGSAETDGHFIIRGGAGDDSLTGGQQSDTFNLTLGGADSVYGEGGDDTASFGAAFDSNDTVDGGTGYNTIVLDGDYTAIDLSGSALTHIQKVIFTAGHSYTGVDLIGDITGGSSDGLTLDALGLQASDHFAIDGGQATRGYSLDFGAGSVSAIGSNLADTFYMATFGSNDQINGGAGNDTLILNGDFSAGLSISSTMLQNVENIILFSGYSYDITLADDGVVTSSLAIDGGSLLSTDTLTFDGTAETGGSFAITGGAGNDAVYISGGTVMAGSTYDGGAGSDTLTLSGDLSTAFTIGAMALTSVETLTLEGSSAVNLTFADGNVQSGNTLTVDASLDTGSSVTIDGSAATDGNFRFVAGPNANSFTGGAGDDEFDYGGTSFFANGSSGNDTVVFTAATSSLALTNSIAENIRTLEFTGGAAYTGVSVTGDLTGNGSTHNGALTIDASAAAQLQIDLTAATSNAYDLTGSSGADTIRFGTNFSASDTIDGGAGSDTVSLSGTYGATTLTATTLVNVETLDLIGYHSYDFITNDATVAAGETLTVVASGASQLIFNGAAETDGSFIITSASGNDVLTGGAGADTFNPGGGNDTLSGNGGDDIFNFNSLGANDKVDGGAGNDTLNLQGDYVTGLTFSATTLVSVETINLANGGDYNLITNDATVAAGATLTVNGSALGTGYYLDINASAETDGYYYLIGGAGADTLTGGAGADTFDLTHGGNDTVTGGHGQDLIDIGSSTGAVTLHYNAVSDSADTLYDTVEGGDFGKLVFAVSGISGAVTGVDAGVSGALSTASFDSDLAAAIGADQLAAHHALLFTATSGTLSGDTFLIVDENGTAGYQAGHDLVIQLENVTGTLTTGNFS
ncbi:MAG TPA: calcium-binding protein, partial [Rhizomicrobium sp.]